MKLKNTEKCRDEGAEQKTTSSVRVYCLPFNASLEILSRRR